MNHNPPIPGITASGAMSDWIDKVHAAGAHLPDKLALTERSLTGAMSALGDALAAIGVSQTDAANLYQSQLKLEVVQQKGRALEGAALDQADSRLKDYRAALASAKATLEKYALPAGMQPGQGGDAVQALVIEQVLETLKTAGSTTPSAILGAVERIARAALASDSKGAIAALTSEPVRLFYDRCGCQISWVYSGIARAVSAASDGGDVYEQSRLDLLGLVSSSLNGMGDAVAIALYQARQLFNERYAAVPPPPGPTAGVIPGGIGGAVPPLTTRHPYWGR